MAVFYLFSELDTVYLLSFEIKSELLVLKRNFLF